MTTKLPKNLATVMLLLVVQAAWAQRYNQLITNPPLLKSANGNFTITAHDSSHNFYPSQTTPSGIGGDTLLFNKPIPTMAYNQATYLGPTMVWRGGQLLNLSSVNRINGQSTTIHWHGLNLPADMDGGPHEVIPPNGTFPSNFTVVDPVQTCWYHAHLMDSTVLQVINGLAGMLIVENTADSLWSILPHSYDTNDFPVVIQDKNFNFTSGSGIDTITSLNVLGPFGAIHNPGNGPFTLVNGLMNGYMKVPPALIRLRLLNGAYRKAFQIAIGSDSTSSPASYLPMYLIATDGGYVNNVIAIDSLILGPGERYEVLVNLTGKAPKSRIYLSNRSASLPIAGPPPAGAGPGYITGGFASQSKNAIMAFEIDTTIKPKQPYSVPANLLPYVVDISNVDTTRTKVLGNQNNNTGGGGPFWTIDGDTMDMMRLDDTILVGRKEIWNIVNKTNVYHPFHIHKVQFQVLDISDTLGNVLMSYTGNPKPLPVNMRGYKDDVLVPAFGALRFVTSFDYYGSDTIDPMMGFMYHCHILTHEDNGMMHQFIVLDSNAYRKYVNPNLPFFTSVNKLNTGSFMLYPNPAGNVLNLKGSSTSAGTLRITDILGRTLKEEKVMPFNGVIPVDIADLPRGMVFVEWNSGNTHFIQKVLLR